MKNDLYRFIFFLLLWGLIVPLTMAQEEEAKYEINGKVGKLSHFSQEYESTVMIELNIVYSINKHVAISGGAAFANFNGPSEVLLRLEGLMEYLNTFAPLRIDNIRMDEQIFTGKLIFKGGGKKISPYFAAGMGAYQFRYSQNVFGTDPIFKEEVPIPLYHTETYFGINVGGGVDYYLSDFLSLKFECCYHKIFYELIEKQLSINGGFGFMF